MLLSKDTRYAPQRWHQEAKRQFGRCYSTATIRPQFVATTGSTPPACVYPAPMPFPNRHLQHTKVLMEDLANMFL